MSLVSTPFSTEENGARNQGIARDFCRMLVRFLPPMSVNKETSCGKMPGFHSELKKLEERTSNETSEGRNLITIFHSAVSRVYTVLVQYRFPSSFNDFSKRFGTMSS